MNIKNLIYLLIISMAVFMVGCDGDDLDIDLNRGEGSIVYDGKTYPLDILSVITGTSGGVYMHDAIMTYTADGNNMFSFSIMDENPAMVAGTYDVKVNGGNTARFSIGEDIGDVLVGTLTISISNNVYTFNFHGTTVDENEPIKEVKATYKGEKAEKQA